MIYIEQQLEMLRKLQEVRGPVLDPLLRCLNLVDTGAYATMLIAFIWIGCSWRWGARIGFVIILNAIVNAAAKGVFDSPRPLVFDPSLAMVAAEGNGFPSGGAQTAMLLGSLLIYYWDSKWAWPIGLCYILIISLSRMMLGVHFPLDVLGGWVIGLLLLVLFINALRPIERFSTKKPLLVLCLVCFLSVCLFPFYTKLSVSAAATACGLYISTRYLLYFVPPPQVGKRILLGLFGALTSLGIGWALHALPIVKEGRTVVEVAAIGLWVSLIASPLCKKVFDWK